MQKNSRLKQLQRITLQSQGLSSVQAFGKGKKAVLQALEHLGYIQIDTLSVVARAHHHTLWTRVPNYQSEYLDQLVKEQKIFEYWFHAAAYLPMKDFRFALPKMLYFKRGESPYYKNVDAKVAQYVHDRIRIEGPQKARDFQTPNPKSGTWWNWKPAKVALEKLFMQGDLMICGRDGMEKIYDLTERVLPEAVNTTMPTPLELAEYLVNTHLRAYGFTTIKQATHLRKGAELKKNVQQVLQSMLEEGVVQQLDIEGMPPLFIHNALLESKVKKPSARVQLLSPFDNAIIHRDRIQQVFDFDFKLECYLPKEKRTYGYFCLPILLGDQLIGRVDCKAHRKSAEFELIHLHIEDTETDIDLLLEAFVKTVQRFASFNECKTISITKVSPHTLTEKFKAALES